MPRNGSGTYSLPAGNPIAANSTANSTLRNDTFSDIATAITNSMARNGEAPPTADIPWGTNKITSLKDGTNLTDAANLKIIQNQVCQYVGTVGGTVDAITLTPSVTPAALAAGQRFSFIAAGANTAAVTINVAALGVKAFTKRGSTALAAGDIASGALVVMEYDGTRFQLISPAGATALGSMATQDLDAVNIDGGTIDSVTIDNLDAALDIDDGGTGEVTASAAFTALKQAATTSATGVVELGTEAEMQSGTDTSRVPSISVLRTGFIVDSAKTVTTSGTESDITGIPSWAKHIRGRLVGVSTNGTSVLMIQGIDSGGEETSGYSGTVVVNSTSGAGLSAISSGFLLEHSSPLAPAATSVREVTFQMDLSDSSANEWSFDSSNSYSNLARNARCTGSKAMSSALTGLRLTTLGGSNTLDAGYWIISWW